MAVCVLLLASAFRAGASSSRLPTGQILSPAGVSVALDGTMAANLVRIPGKTWVAVICSGARQSLSIVDTSTHQILSTVDFQLVNANSTGYTVLGDAYYGLAVSPDGKTLYASRGSEDRVASYKIGDDGALTESLSFYEKPLTAKTANFIAGVALDPDGDMVYATNNLTDTVVGIPYASGVAPASPLSWPADGSVPYFSYPTGGYPLALAVDKQLNKAYVASERGSSLSVIGIGVSSSFSRNSMGMTILVGSHPDALVNSADGGRLFVANGDSDTISIIDTVRDRVMRTVPLRPSPVSGLPGATPTGLCLSPDQRTLYVTLADMNAVAVVKLNAGLDDGAVVGYIPTGWYPSAVTLTAAGNVLIVANAKGSAAANPNPLGPNPVNHQNLYYIHNILTSSLSFIPVPGVAALALMTKQVLAGNSISHPIDPDAAQSAALLSGLPIKHVIYIIKENRTYDEVLGDLPQGNGAPSLTLFGKDITPNLHSLATNFVTLDNFYCCAEVSADGWNWSTSGFANEYVQRSVPENYSERSDSARRDVRGYDYEGENHNLAVSDRGIPDVAESPGGYIWDSVKKAGLTYRDYGAFLSADGNRAAKPNLLSHTDYDFCYFDLKFADSDAYSEFGLTSPGESTFGPHKIPSRYTAWKKEFDQFVAHDNLPSFELVRFMRDHTSGTAAGANTPQAMAADNDYAVGELVDAVSHSKYWKSTAIFIVEDDAQNGPDHVDCHRSTCYVISPFIKRLSVDHHFYNTDSVLHSMELLLHSPVMTRLDSSAPPIGSFTAKPDLAAYKAITPSLSLLSSINRKSAYGSNKSAKMNFAIADDVPEDELNDVLWHSIKGANSTMPSPRHAVLGQ
jgi:YVTN family beta-propeller protein